MTDSEALTEARVRRILAEIDETAPANDGPGAVSAFYTSLSFTEVRDLCTLALSALGTAPAAGVPEGVDRILRAWDAGRAVGVNAMRASVKAMLLNWQAECEARGCISEYNQGNVLLDRLDAIASPTPATAAEIRAGALREAATIAAEFPNMGEYSGREIAARLRALSEATANGK